MRAAIIACLLFASPSMCAASSLFANCTFDSSISAEVPFDGSAPVISQREDDLSLVIADEVLEDNRAMLVGNNGTADLKMTIGPFAISYSEGVHSGAVTATTIYMNAQMPSGEYSAAHIRTTNLAPPDSPIGSAIPSLRLGRCQVRRG